ncbi:hypothetical protein [Mangrovibacterium sp.]|uniref:hypothetical protein n=1 Tax=Mangrovibacterium sp. TaxID=1961364 RepID=UPI0035631361
MKPTNSVQTIIPVEVFTGTSLQASMLKIMLDNARIYSFLKNDTVENKDLWWSGHEASGAVKVIVSSSNVEEAHEIVKKFVNQRVDELNV